MEDNEIKPPNGFVVLGAELKRRLLSPIRHVTFWTYLVFGVIISGGLSVWFEFWQVYIVPAVPHPATDHLRVALITFFPALVGSVSTQMLFQEAGRNKRMVAFAVGVGFLTLMTAGWLTFDKALDETTALQFASLACIVSVLVWWVANGSDPAFQDDFIDEAPLGGDPTSEPPGNLTNFTV